MEKKLFLATAAPFRRRPAIARDLPLCTASGKGGDVDLRPPRLVALICQPLSIGRNCWRPLVKSVLHNGKRLPITRQRQRPDVIAGFILVEPPLIDQIVAVG